MLKRKGRDTNCQTASTKSFRSFEKERIPGMPVAPKKRDHRFVSFFFLSSFCNVKRARVARHYAARQSASVSRASVASERVRLLGDKGYSHAWKLTTRRQRTSTDLHELLPCLAGVAPNHSPLHHPLVVFDCFQLCQKSLRLLFWVLPNEARLQRLCIDVHFTCI